MRGLDEENRITQRVIAAAIAVHRELGPGLLEWTYRSCLEYQLGVDGMLVESEVPLPVRYRGVTLAQGYRCDLLVEQQVIVEVKAVRALEDLHVAQLLTYLKLSGNRVGLLINFNVPVLKVGIRRVILARRSASQ